MKYLLFVLFYCCLIHSVKGQVVDLSLSDCIQLAVQNNPTLLQDELNTQRDAIQFKQAKNNLLPNLRANINQGWNQGRNIDPITNQYVEQNLSSGQQAVNLALPLFDGFKNLHEIRRRSDALEAGKLEYQSKVNALKLDVIEAYLQVLMATDMLEQAKKQLAVTQEQVNRAETLHKEGAIAPGDYFDLKGQINIDRNTVDHQKTAFYSSKVRLATLMQMDPSVLGKLETIDYAKEVAWYSRNPALFEQAKTAIPDIYALDWRIKEAQQALKIAKGDYWPSLSLAAGISSNYSSSSNRDLLFQVRNNLGKSVSLHLSIPIFSRFMVRNQVKLARLDLSAAQYARLARLNSLREATAHVIFNMDNINQHIKNLQEQRINFQESFRIATVHFEAGNSNSVIFLTAKNKVDNAQSQLLVKQYEWLLQKYINDYYAGTLKL
ncbi:TolC family protein [Sphingobacterium sp. Mn56C]|uniref:TolC family protein n=1 Tax=Sphingobacterium sp. Mn56C TaxID=3395261 RepID=UPI003BE51E6E